MNAVPSLLKINWEVGPDMPYIKKDKDKVECISSNVQSVVIEDTMFVGGEVTANREHGCTVMAYSTKTRKWRILPPHTARSFAMASVNNHLVVVGGVDKSGADVSLLAEWNLGAWSYPYPPMPTARSCSSAVSFGGHLFVVGGMMGTPGTEGQPKGASSSSLTIVEVLDVSDKVWYKSFPLPIPWTSMKPALVGHTCFFMGGNINNGATSRVFSVSLPALISQLDSANDKCTLWTEVYGLNITRSTPVSMNGFLYAFGGLRLEASSGKSKDKGPLSTILCYRPDMEKWVEAGKLNECICCCASAVTSGGMILVTAGEDDRGYSKEINEGILK